MYYYFIHVQRNVINIISLPILNKLPQKHGNFYSAKWIRLVVNRQERSSAEGAKQLRNRRRRITGGD